MCRVHGGRWRGNIRVHVLKPQDRGIASGIGCLAYAIDRDTCDVVEAGDRHSNVP